MGYFSHPIRLNFPRPILAPLRHGLMLLAGPALFASCSAVVPFTPYRAERVLYQWHDDGGPGKVAIRIDLNQQIATYTRGGRPIGWSYVATGKEGHDTSPGSYTITEKIVDKYSGSYGWIEDGYGNVVNGDATPGSRVPSGCRYVPAPMPYWMRLTSHGIGMHAGIIPQPGEPASHGCIRLPKPFAPQLFDVVQVGTPVTITRGESGPPPLQALPAGLATVH